MAIEFLNLSLSTQFSLAVGYLAYIIAYPGVRHRQNARDAIFTILTFSSTTIVIATVLDAITSYIGIESAGSAFGNHLFKFSYFFFSAIAILLLACLLRWRRRAISWDDDIASAWLALLNEVGRPKTQVGQCFVQLVNGRVLCLKDRRNFDEEIWEGLYLSPDGAVIMAVEEEEPALETKLEKTDIRENVIDSEWGTLLTYVPAERIERVEIRIKQTN